MRAYPSLLLAQVLGISVSSLHHTSCVASFRHELFMCVCVCVNLCLCVCVCVWKYVQLMIARCTENIWSLTSSTRKMTVTNHGKFIQNCPILLNHYRAPAAFDAQHPVAFDQQVKSISGCFHTYGSVDASCKFSKYSAIFCSKVFLLSLKVTAISRLCKTWPFESVSVSLVDFVFSSRAASSSILVGYADSSCRKRIESVRAAAISFSREIMLSLPRLRAFDQSLARGPWKSWMHDVTVCHGERVCMISYIHRYVLSMRGL